MKRVLLPVVMLMFFLAGCSTPQTQALRTAPMTAETGVVELRDVPWVPGDERMGGPAALATLLKHTGRDVTPGQVAAALDPALAGDDMAVGLALVARREGRLVYPLAPQLEAMLAALNQGYPVLVRQNKGLSFWPSWHYAVVVGADRQGETFWLRSGSAQREPLSFASFERGWARGGHWAALIIDPRQIPDSLDGRMVIRELAMMERAGAVADAQAGFHRALLNWPDQKAAWLGLASTSQQLGEIDRAESTLRELVRRAPQYGAGLNNLADFLLRTGRPLEALPFAERAVSLLDIPQTRATLQAARAAMEPIKTESLPAQPGDLSPAEVRPVATTSPAGKAGKAGARKHRKAARRSKAPVAAGKAATGEASRGVAH